MNFQEFVHSKGITQMQLAESMGCTRAHISLWATGENFPTPKSINKMVDGFAKLDKEVTYDDLYISLLQTKKEKGAQP